MQVPRIHAADTPQPPTRRPTTATVNVSTISGTKKRLYQQSVQAGKLKQPRLHELQRFLRPRTGSKLDDGSKAVEGRQVKSDTDNLEVLGGDRSESFDIAAKLQLTQLEVGDPLETKRKSSTQLEVGFPSVAGSAQREVGDPLETKRKSSTQLEIGNSSMEGSTQQERENPLETRLKGSTRWEVGDPSAESSTKYQTGNAGPKTSTKLKESSSRRVTEPAKNAKKSENEIETDSNDQIVEKQKENSVNEDSHQSDQDKRRAKMQRDVIRRATEAYQSQKYAAAVEACSTVSSLIWSLVLFHL
jgi:hypothetical protein